MRIMLRVVMVLLNGEVGQVSVRHYDFLLNDLLLKLLKDSFLLRDCGG